MAATSPRPSWSGILRFGLVSIPVQAYNAVSSHAKAVTFNQLHKDCHSRIKYEKACPIHGPVESSEIVSGYEYDKGKYVEIDSDEIKALRTEGDRVLTLDNFVATELVDPLYFDGRMYYLLPDGRSAIEPYSVFHQALGDRDRSGVGHVLFSGKQQLAVVRSVEGLIHMAMLNYSQEVRQAEDFSEKYEPVTPDKKQVRMAMSLIDAWSVKKFDLSQYQDDYYQRVQELVDAKVEGKEIVVPPESEAGPPVINLMEALKQSLAAAAKQGAAAPSGPGKPAASRKKRTTAEPAQPAAPKPRRTSKKAAAVESETPTAAPAEIKAGKGKSAGGRKRA